MPNKTRIPPKSIPKKLLPKLKLSPSRTKKVLPKVTLPPSRIKKI